MLVHQRLIQYPIVSKIGIIKRKADAPTGTSACYLFAKITTT